MSRTLGSYCIVTATSIFRVNISSTQRQKVGVVLVLVQLGAAELFVVAIHRFAQATTT